MVTESSAPAVPYVSFEEQRESATLGMWLFLAAEIIFFGSVILAFVYYRVGHARDFDAASNHTKVLLGTVNTGVLLTSSLLVALGVHAGRKGDNRTLAKFLFFTILLGIAFLGIKTAEYALEYREGLLPGPRFIIRGADPKQARLFFLFYFIMTGIHALHVVIGVVLLAVILVRALLKAYTPDHHHAVEVGGLYWHFVDVVWIFIFPLLYLLGRHHG